MKRDLLITLLQSLDRMHSIGFGTNDLGLFERTERTAVERARLLIAGESLTAIFCTQCGEHHSCEVRWIGEPGIFGRPYYECPNDASIGRVDLTPSHLATFRPSLARLTDFLAQTICPNDRVSTIVPERLYSLGVLRSHEVQYRIYLGIGCRRKDAAIEVLPKLQTVRNTAILIPTYIPEWVLHPSSFFVSLTDMLRIEGEKIVVDIGALLRDAAASEKPSDVADHMFMREGAMWRIIYGGKQSYIKHSKGALHIARLLSSPGVEIAALKFVATSFTIDTTFVSDKVEENIGDLGGTINSLDDLSRDKVTDMASVYDAKERRAKLDAKRLKAIRFGQTTKEAQLAGEIAGYDSYISSSVNIHGGPRTITDVNETARKAVYNAIKRCMSEMKEAHPALHIHLDRFLITGRVFSYIPAPNATWTIKY